MRFLLPALLAFAALAAAAAPTSVSTRTEGIIETSSKPYLDDRTGMYYYKTTEGKDASIRKEEVVEILER